MLRQYIGKYCLGLLVILLVICGCEPASHVHAVKPVDAVGRSAKEARADPWQSHYSTGTLGAGVMT